MKINFVNREALDWQLSITQPPFWAVFGIIMAFLVSERILKTVFRVSAFILSGSWDELFRASWLVGMLLVCTLAALFLNRRFPNALRVPSAAVTKGWRTQIFILLLALPWLVEQLGPLLILQVNFHHLFVEAKGNAQLVQECKQLVGDVHIQLWANLGYGSDLPGIILSSFSILLFPIFEERFYRGYMLTQACRRCHPIAAVTVVAFFFALSHILITQSAMQLGRIFLMGVCCGLVRLHIGRWHDALWLHLFVNFCFLLPRAYVACLYFVFLPRL